MQEARLQTILPLPERNKIDIKHWLDWLISSIPIEWWVLPCEDMRLDVSHLPDDTLHYTCLCSLELLKSHFSHSQVLPSNISAGCDEHCTELGAKKVFYSEIEIKTNSDWNWKKKSSLKSFFLQFFRRIKLTFLYLLSWSILDAVCVGLSVIVRAVMKAVDIVRWNTGTSCLDQKQWISVWHDHICPICCHHQVHQYHTLEQDLGWRIIQW